MSLDSPLISIIIPAYNAQNYLHRCLESCINQSHKNIEIVVVDDDSTDSTLNIAKDFASKHSNIRVVHNDSNRGSFEARLVGLELAVGEFVAFLDSDDYITPDFCSRLLEIFAEKGDSVDVVACQYASSLEDAKRKNRNSLHSMPIASQAWKLFRVRVLREAAALKAQILANQNTKGLVYFEDLLFGIMIVPFVRGFVHIPEPLYFYIENPQSTTRVKSKNSLLSGARAINFMDMVMDSPLWRAEAQVRDFAQGTVRHVKHQFYIFQRHSSCLVRLDGAVFDSNVYLRSLYYAAHYGKTSRSIRRAIMFILSFGIVKK